MTALFRLVACGVLLSVVPSFAQSPNKGSEPKRERTGKDGKRDKEPKAVELRAPLPLPVTIQSGRERVDSVPAGGSCQSAKSCTLEFNPPPGKVLIVTSVWSAAPVRCDDLTVTTPANGAPITVNWRCAKGLSVRGAGAGYAGYVIAE